MGDRAEMGALLRLVAAIIVLEAIDLGIVAICHPLEPGALGGG
jgi:hypothetical protein